MNVIQMHKRLDKLQTQAGEFDHLTDSELQQSLETLNKLILAEFGAGDAVKGFELLKGHFKAELPDTLEDFVADNSVSLHAQLATYVETQHQHYHG